MSFDVDAFRSFESAGWEQVASGYSESPVVNGLMGKAADALVAAVGAAKGSKVLDLACGPGLASRLAVELGAEVVGVDVAEAMVTQARQQVPGAEFRAALAEALPFDDDSFDALICGFGLPHFAEPEAVLSEAARVLEPGGRAAFTTWCSPDKVPFFGLVFTAVVEHGTLEVEIPEGPDMFRFAVADEAVPALEAAGFGDVAIDELALVADVDDPADAMDLVIRATVRTRSLFEAQTPAAQKAISASVTESVAAMSGDGRSTIPMPAVLISAAMPA